MIDATGMPKAACHYLRRAWAPVAMHISDEGGNGLVVHVANDRSMPVTSDLEVTLWRAGDIAVGRGVQAIDVPARGALEIPLVALFDGFLDPGWAYRFGPPACDLVVASLAGCAPAYFFPLGLPSHREVDVGLSAELRELELTVRTKRFAQSIAIDLPGFAPEEDWFHLAPGASCVLRLTRVGDNAPRGTVTALNAEVSARVVVA